MFCGKVNSLTPVDGEKSVIIHFVQMNDANVVKSNAARFLGNNYSDNSFPLVVHNQMLECIVDQINMKL